jgi:ubiquinone/menaquinone biosynthesis C-methylase UbiE
MFDIITRKEYWDWLDELAPQSRYRGFLRRVRRSLALQRYHLGVGREYALKTVQDTYIYHLLRNEKGKKIIEAGGGNSRILRLLRNTNECWLVDRFEGMGNGPRRKPFLPKVRIVQDYLGEFNKLLPDGYFDYVFSISVAEHIPLDYLDNFFRDCARLLKPGGRMVHAIDTYVYDPTDRQTLVMDEFAQRIRKYLEFADRPDLGIHLIEPAKINADFIFSCRYASLPDNIMYRWQQNRPSVKREIGQLVSIKAEWIKE